MFQLTTIVLSLVAIAISFFSLIVAWAVLAVATTPLLVMLVGVKQKRYKNIPELSEAGNAMMQKFGHYYTMPAAGRDCSASASTIAFSGIAIAVIGAFNGFWWWGWSIAGINWLLMGLVARAFNPSHYLADSSERLAHEEVVSFILAKKQGGK